MKKILILVCKTGVTNHSNNYYTTRIRIGRVSSIVLQNEFIANRASDRRPFRILSDKCTVARWQQRE